MPWEFIHKPEEKRIFIRVFPKQPREGDAPAYFESAELELAEAMKAKYAAEQKYGVSLLNFHKDPMAGGLFSRNPPKGQVWRPVPPSDANMPKYQPVGGVNPNEDRSPNIQPRTAEMYNVPMWVGEYL